MGHKLFRKRDPGHGMKGPANTAASDTQSPTPGPSIAAAAPAQPPAPVPVTLQSPAVPVVVQMPAGPVSVSIQGPPDPARPTFWFWFNLVVFIGFGSALSWWFFYYTDWLEAFTGLLSLTGIFAWLALVTKVVPESRLQYVQSKVWAPLFESRLFGLIVAALFAAGLIGASCVGTIEVANAQGGVDQSLWVYQPGSEPALDSAERVPANGHYRAVLPAGRDYKVRIAGYPEQTMRVQAWRRQERQVPFSFLRPVVLIWPEKKLVSQLKGKKANMTVKIDQKPLAAVPFNDKPVWLGCEALAIPRHVLDGWVKELTDEKLGPRVIEQVEAEWSQPEPLKDGPLELRPGMIIQVELFRENEKLPYANTVEYTVRPVKPASAPELQDMVQPLALRLKN